MNDTGAFLLQTMLYLVNTKSPVPRMLNITLLEEPITEPFFQSKSHPIVYIIHSVLKELRKQISDKSRLKITANFISVVKDIVDHN